jgi:hypothetical protein
MVRSLKLQLLLKMTLMFIVPALELACVLFVQGFNLRILDDKSERKRSGKS